MKIHINRISTKISGAEIYTLYLLEALKTVNNLHISFSTDNKELYRRVSALKIDATFIHPYIEEIGTKKQFLSAISNLSKYFSAYFTLFKNKKPDIIIFESMTEKIFLTQPLNARGYKVIWIEHGPLFSTERAWIIKTFYRFASKYVKKIIAVSKNTEKDLTANGIAASHVQTIYIGIPKSSNNTKLTKPVLQIPKGHTVIGFIGSITKAKGIYHFVDFAAYFLKQDKKYKFLILGDGENLLDVKKKVKSLGISHAFIFTGFVDSKAYLPLIDILVFPSMHSEGISIALLEGVNAGIPMVASDAGGNKEIIHDGYNGYICQTFEKEAYYKAALRAIRQRKTFATNGKKLINEQFNSDTMVKSFRQIFEE